MNSSHVASEISARETNKIGSSLYPHFNVHCPLFMKWSLDASFWPNAGHVICAPLVDHNLLT